MEAYENFICETLNKKISTPQSYKIAINFFFVFYINIYLWVLLSESRNIK